MAKEGGSSHWVTSTLGLGQLHVLAWEKEELEVETLVSLTKDSPREKMDDGKVVGLVKVLSYRDLGADAHL